MIARFQYLPACLPLLAGMGSAEDHRRCDRGCVDYSVAVSEIWRHHEIGSATQDYLGLVRYATLAASSHNTQPWKFKLEPGRIAILPDLSRRCPEVDPDDHHLYASLGCATGNLLLAAQAVGLKGHCEYDASASSVQVAFEGAPSIRSALFEAIPRRQCSRAEYDGATLSEEQLRLLQEAGHGRGVSVMLLTDSRQKEQVAEYVAAGNTAQLGDPRWTEEIRKWIRFNKRDAVRTGDGLYGATLGIPGVPGWLGGLLMRVAASAKHQNQKDIAHIRSSGAVAVVFSEADDSRRPDLMVRIGRGPEMPRSLRRPIGQVLVSTRSA